MLRRDKTRAAHVAVMFERAGPKQARLFDATANTQDYPGTGLLYSNQETCGVWNPCPRRTDAASPDCWGLLHSKKHMHEDWPEPKQGSTSFDISDVRWTTLVRDP